MAASSTQLKVFLNFLSVEIEPAGGIIASQQQGTAGTPQHHHPHSEGRVGGSPSEQRLGTDSLFRLH